MTARAIPTASSIHPLAVLAPPSIEYEILRHLSDFGEACGRYANLDALASGRAQADPLVGWNAITAKILEEDVPTSKKQAVEREAIALATAVSGSVHIVAYDLDKKPLSLREWFEVPRMQALAASRAVVRVFRILCPLKYLLTEVNQRAIVEDQQRGPQDPAVPFMYEFLDFVWPDERVNSRKKRWPRT